MCDKLTIMGPIKTGSAVRNGEMILIQSRMRAICCECGGTHDLVLSVNLPCSVARTGQDKAVEHVGRQLRMQSMESDHFLGPISSVRWSEAIMQQAQKTDMQRLAGEMFLLDMPIQGRA
jgi:hypothetical protein